MRCRDMPYTDEVNGLQVYAGEVDAVWTRFTKDAQRFTYDACDRTGFYCR
jgi:hypothetical protein